MLISKGITAWQRALARLTCASTSGTTPASSPAPQTSGPVTTELIHALAGLAVALAGT